MTHKTAKLRNIDSVNIQDILIIWLLKVKTFKTHATCWLLSGCSVLYEGVL